MDRYCGLRRRAMTGGIVWALGICGVLGPGVDASAAAATEGSPERLNVVLVSLSVVRPDHLSCYGYHRQTTPHIDQIAQEGILFTQAFSQAPNTLPSQLSILTSRYPTKGWLSWMDADLDPSTETLVEVLKRHGYQTAALTDLARGALRPILDSRAFQSFDRLVEGVKLSALPEDVVAWLAAHRDTPFFLFLHGFDAHGPHILQDRDDAKRFSPTYHGQVPSTEAELDAMVASALAGREMPGVALVSPARMRRYLWRRRFVTPDGIRPEDLRHLLALYDAQLYTIDRGLKRLFQALEDLVLMERTLLVIYSDHGEAFGEHGKYASHERCYEEVTRMVLLVRDPRLLPRRDRRESRAESRDGRTVTQLIQGIDVMPTILELLDLPIPESAQGRSLVPLLRTGRDPGREEVAVSVNIRARAIRTSAWTLISKWGTPAELYDRRSDPHEQHNVITRHPSVVTRLQRQLDARVPAAWRGASADPEQWKHERTYW